MFLRQSTAQVILFGPCLDKTDGVAEETGLTLAQADMRLSKDGGSYAQKSAAGNATHDSDGYYATTLSTTDTDTVGILKFNSHQPANMLPVWETFYVVEEAIYDALFSASSNAFNGAAGSSAVGLVDLVTTTTTNTDMVAEAPTDVATGTKQDTMETSLNAIPTTAMRGTNDAALAAVVTEVRMATLTDWINGGRLDLLLDAIKAITDQFVFTVANEVDANILSISSDTATADNLQLLLTAPNTFSSAKTGTLTATSFTTNLTEATDDHYNGKLITFTSGVLKGQTTDIDSVGGYVGATKLINCTALTEAPGNSDTFVIH